MNNKIEQNTENIYKQNNVFPDPDEFINSSFKDYSLIELQDALIAFSKSISKTKAELIHFIPKNFTKFIRCKDLMEQLGNDYSKFDLSLKSSSNSISNIISNVENLLKIHNIIDLDQDTGSMEMCKDAELLDLKEILRSNISNFPIFIETLEKFRNTFNSSESLADIKPEIVDFLEMVYEKIIDERTTFEEACNLVDVYNKAFECQTNLTDVQKSSKILNTILVQYKDMTNSKMKVSDEYFNFLLKSVAKVTEYLKDEQLDDAIHHFFNILKNLLSQTDPKYCRIIFIRIEDFLKSIKTAANNLKEFRNGFSDLKVAMFVFFVQKADIKTCSEIFNIFLSVFNQNETKKAQEVLLNKVEKHLSSVNLKGFAYLKDHDKDIKIIAPCLGSRESKNVKELSTKLKDKRDIEINEILSNFKNLFEIKEEKDVLNCEVKILMEAVKIIDSSEKYHKDILRRCRDLISKRPVIFYYLRIYLNSESPVLNKEEDERVKELSYQFDFLLNGDKNIIS